MERSVKTRHVAKLLAYRLAVYDPCEPEDSPEFCGPVFRDCPADLLVMKLAIEMFNRKFAKREESLCLAAFPWEESHD